MTDKLVESKALYICIEALRAAEMRQGCSNHTYYAEILLKQIRKAVEAEIRIELGSKAFEKGKKAAEEERLDRAEIEKKVREIVLEIRQYLCNTEFAPEPFTTPVDLNKLMVEFPNQILSLLEVKK